MSLPSNVILAFALNGQDPAMFKRGSGDGIKPCLSPLSLPASVLHVLLVSSSLQTQRRLRVLASLLPFSYFSNIFMSYEVAESSNADYIQPEV